MDSQAFASSGVTELQSGYARGDFSPADVVESLRQRALEIDAPDSRHALRSILAHNNEVVKSAIEPGPLSGIPVLIKDNIEAVGLPGTAGSAALAGRTVTADAPLVARLRAAGALIIGSTNLSEWANLRSSQSTSGWSAVGGLTKNPWKLDRSTGGSSSGSGSSVAAGLAPLAVGTETDGSITCPASLNGVVGIKPTVGTVSTQGVVPLSASQDSPGPMARSVYDAALMLEVLSGKKGFVEATRATSDSLRIGIAPHWYTGHSATDALFDEVVAALGWTNQSSIEATPEEIHGEELTVLLAEFYEELGQFLSDRPGLQVQSMADVVAFNRDHADVELKHFGQDLLEKALEIGGKGESYRQARQRCVDWANSQFKPAFEEFDLFVAPAYAPAWRSDFELGHKEAEGGTVTSPAALLGYPIVTVPMGLVDGLPVGLSLVGPAGSEATLITAAASVERAVAFNARPQFLI